MKPGSLRSNPVLILPAFILSFCLLLYLRHRYWLALLLCHPLAQKLCDSHCLQNQVQIPKPSSQELASATLPSISTLEFPLCARYLLFIPPNPHSACLHWFSPGEPGYGISFSSRGWWFPGWAWPIGRGGRARQGVPGMEPRQCIHCCDSLPIRFL